MNREKPVKEIHVRVDDTMRNQLGALRQYEREQKKTLSKFEASYSSVLRNGLTKYYKEIFDSKD